MRQLFYYKVRQKFITKCVRFFITKCDDFITKCNSYYEMRLLLQIATVQLFISRFRAFSQPGSPYNLFGALRIVGENCLERVA